MRSGPSGSCGRRRSCRRRSRRRPGRILRSRFLGGCRRPCRSSFGRSFGILYCEIPLNFSSRRRILISIEFQLFQARERASRIRIDRNLNGEKSRVIPIQPPFIPKQLFSNQ